MKTKSKNKIWNSKSVGACLVRRTIVGLVVVGAMGTAMAHGQALVQNRIAARVRSDQMQALKGTVHPLVAAAKDQGPLSGSATIPGMAIVFRRSAAQEADLKNLLKAQQTPGSTMYRQWLGPGQFAARYGVSQQDLAKVSAWLRSQGFAIGAIPASADRIVFSGTAAQVNVAFQTQMHGYVLNGRSYWANATPVSVPQAIAGITLRVAHLNTFRPLPHFVRRPVHTAMRNEGSSLHPQYTLQDSNGNEINFLAPADIATIYNVQGLYNNSITGKGQTIAIVGQTDIVQHESDIKEFRSLSGLDAGNLPTQVVVPGTTAVTVSPSDLGEADLDVEWSGAVAKDAKVLYVTVGGNQNYSVFNSLQYAVEYPLIDNDSQFVPVISISYGGCEGQDLPPTYIEQLDATLEQANAQGQTVVASSGDDGSAGCDDTDSAGSVASKGFAVVYPASSPYATAVGGTSFSGDINNQSQYWNKTNNSDNGSAIGYIPETTWNNTPDQAGLSNSRFLAASGGGVSVVFSKPSWQAGAGVPNDGKRDVPDVSLAADANHDGYVLCTQETTSSGTLSGSSSCGGPIPYFDANRSGYLFGGTSIAAPQIAAMITLWNQEAGNAKGVGNANAIFYSSAKSSPGVFHDVTTGSNAVVCSQGSANCVANGSGGYAMSGYSAGAGYDRATGLGSVDATAMGAAWPTISIATQPSSQSTFSMVSNPTALSVAPGGNASVSVLVTPAANFTGTIALGCSGLPANTTCTFSPASINVTAANSGSAQTVALTIANSGSARLASPGPTQRNWPIDTALGGVFGFVLLGLSKRRRLPSRWASRWMGALLLAAGLMAASALTACGGGNPSTSGKGGGGGGGGPASTSISVTGTSANTTVTNTIYLTIT